MVNPLRIATSLGVVALGLALATSTVSATGLQGLGGSAMRVVTELTESGALFVWGGMLAGVAQMLRRRSSI